MLFTDVKVIFTQTNQCKIFMTDILNEDFDKQRIKINMDKTEYTG